MYCALQSLLMGEGFSPLCESTWSFTSKTSEGCENCAGILQGKTRRGMPFACGEFHADDKDHALSQHHNALDLRKMGYGHTLWGRKPAFASRLTPRDLIGHGPWKIISRCVSMSVLWCCVKTVGLFVKGVAQRRLGNDETAFSSHFSEMLRICTT